MAPAPAIAAASARLGRVRAVLDRPDRLIDVDGHVARRFYAAWPPPCHVRTTAVEHILRRQQVLPGSPAEVFGFYADAGNLERITPAWLGFRIVTPKPIEMAPGTLIE